MGSYNIVDDGDLILNIDGHAKIRVHSFILRLNSPVFRAMLGPDWLEGQQLAAASATTPATLDLPDDKFLGMLLLCRALHLRADRPHVPGGTLILDAAILADKYDCVAGASHVASTWFSNTESTDHFLPDHFLPELVVATYMFNDASNFARFAGVLILEGLPSYISQNIEEAKDTEKITDAIQTHHDHLHETVIKHIAAFVDKISGVLSRWHEHYKNNRPHVAPDNENFKRVDNGLPEKCKYYEESVIKVQVALAQAEIWPSSTRPEDLESLIKKVEEFELPNVHHYGASCYMHIDGSLQAGFQQDLEDLQNQMANVREEAKICLRCLKDNDEAVGFCSKSH